MSLNLEQKRAIVSEVAAIAARAPNVVAAEYSGLSVADMTRLRQSARSAGVYLKVVRNTLARRAIEGTPFECMGDRLVGPLVLAFAGEEPGSAAKVVTEFAKLNEKLIVKLVVADGRLLEAEAVTRLATLPSLDEARSMFLGVLQGPLGKFVRVLAEPPAKLARLLGAYRDKQQAA